MNKGQQILFRIALGMDESYESEYDGINDSYCRYCDANLSRGEHDEDCDIFGSQEALGKAWTNYIDEKEEIARKMVEEEERKAEAKRIRLEKVPCDKCGKKVTRIGMTDHQKSPACAKHKEKTTLRENEERTGIKCIVDIWINYDGKRCQHCNKPMPDAHPNAKFCSNKGPGNCKDKHHNRQPGRIERAKEYSGFNERQRQLENEMMLSTNPLLRALQMKEGGMSWDEHKDY